MIVKLPDYDRPSVLFERKPPDLDSVRAFILATLALSACGIAGDYKTAVTAFGTAAKKAEASLDSYEQTLDNYAFETNASLALAAPVSLRPAQNDCNLGGARCRLVIQPRAGVMFFGPRPAGANIQSLMAEVIAYAGNLRSDSTVDTAEQVQNTADQTKANAIGLAKSLMRLAQSFMFRPAAWNRRFQPMVCRWRLPPSISAPNISRRCNLRRCGGKPPAWT
jgi:hypothetical protein